MTQVTQLAQITAVTQLLTLQREMVDALRARRRRARSPWRVTSPYPRFDPSAMSAFLDDGTGFEEEEWGAWPEEDEREGGGDLWGVP
jgi:hypothetical protein